MNAKGNRRPNTTLTDDQIQAYLDEVARTGLLMKSAAAADVSYQTIKRNREEHDEFEAAVQDALELYREAIEEEIHRRGIEGVETPVFGSMGANAGTGIVGHVRKYSDKLLEIHAKRHIPAYRDKATIDANITGGVLLVREPPESEEEWRKRHDGDSE
jgi:hypothetical protein